MFYFIKKISKRKKKFVVISAVIFLAAVFAVGIAMHRVPFLNSKNAPSAVKEAVVNPIRFSEETYEKIKEQYWNKISDAKLSELFRLAAEKVNGKSHTLKSKDEAGVTELVKEILASADTETKKRDIVLNLVQVVLYNLQPAGRNALLGQKEEKTFRETVSNIDRSHDLYATVGVPKDAPKEKIDAAYEEERQALAKDKTPEAAEQLKELSYAHQVLSDETAKVRYDETRVEPTVFPHLLSPNVLYLFVSKISPATFDELIAAANAKEKMENLEWLILDIRGNVGGAVDLMQYFLGLFIGGGAYGYDFYHQDNYTPFKTKVQKLPSLDRFRRHIILMTDNATQSSAEILTATFKKYNVALVVGATTRGWGTIENTFPLSATLDETERYSLLLTHSITVREDGEPIEGRGVDPDIDIKTESWKEKLRAALASASLEETVVDILKNPPLK